MAEEIKIKINNYKKIESKLKKLGGKYSGEITVADTYFNQPSNKVLKITEDNKGDFLVKLEKKNGKFAIVNYDRVYDINKIKKELEGKFGIKTVLKKKRRFFDFPGFMVNINLINNVGEFLIVETENPTKEIITKTLGFKNPKYITVPFSDLPQNSEEIFVNGD